MKKAFMEMVGRVLSEGPARAVVIHVTTSPGGVSETITVPITGTVADVREKSDALERVARIIDRERESVSEGKAPLREAEASEVDVKCPMCGREYDSSSLRGVDQPMAGITQYVCPNPGCPSEGQPMEFGDLRFQYLYKESTEPEFWEYQHELGLGEAKADVSLAGMGLVSIRKSDGTQHQAPMSKMAAHSLRREGYSFQDIQFDPQVPGWMVDEWREVLS
jgi:hypothetical protein